MASSIAIKEFNSATFVMDEDGNFHCNHEEVEVYYEQGGDGITEPRGGWYVECLAWDCDGIQDHEVDDLIEAHMPDEEPDYDPCE